MNLQASTGAQPYMDMRSTTTSHLSSPVRIGVVASTSHSSPLTQIVQGKREPFTHFVSIPLATYTELVNKLDAFKRSVLVKMGIDDSIFALPQTFHLTVVMLKLGNKDSLVEAQKILERISSEVSVALKNRPLYVKLKGLKRMPAPSDKTGVTGPLDKTRVTESSEETGETGSLDKTNVLYAPVEEVGDEGRLLNACHTIIDAFANAGFAEKDAKSQFKLHATVMNTVYRKDKSKKKDPFDAQEIHKEFGNNEWGTYLIKEAQISQRFVKDESGYFLCCASLPFPH